MPEVLKLKTNNPVAGAAIVVMSFVLSKFTCGGKNPLFSDCT